MDWTKDLPRKLIVIDKRDVERECELHLVGYSWFGNEIGLEYYYWDMIEDRKVPLLSVRGNSEDEAVLKMKELLKECSVSNQD